MRPSEPKPDDAQTAPAQFLTQNAAEPARLLKVLLADCTFDRGLSVARVEPFDLVARGNKNDFGWVFGTISATGWSLLHETWHP